MSDINKHDIGNIDKQCIDDINQRLKNLEQFVSSMNNKLDILIGSTANIDESCEKMNEHIDFVETTYSSFRQPLNFIKFKIENIMGYGNKKELPAIKSQNEDTLE